MEDLSLVFEKLCEQRSVKPSKQITSMLRGRSSMRLVELDLSSVYLAKNAFEPLADLVAFCNNLRTLNLAYSGMENDSMNALVPTLTEHPSLTSLNASHSELSFPSAKALLQMVKDNPNYVELCLDATDVSAAYVERINMQLELNRRHEVPQKHLEFDTRGQDGGMGRETLKVRAQLGLGPVGGDEDEEWDLRSNLSDCLDVATRNAEDERRRIEEGVLLGAPGMPEHPEDFPIELPVVPGYGDPINGVSSPDKAGAAAADAAHPADARNPNQLFDETHVPSAQRLQANPLRRQNLSEIAAELFGQAGAKWTDPTFSPVPTSIYSAKMGTQERERKLKGIHWRRLGEMGAAGAPPPRLVVNQSSPSLPIQGSFFADKYLIEAMSLLTRHPDMLNSLFLKAQPDIGAYEVQLFKSGSWMRVVVDDWAPCDATGALIGARNDDPNEFWAALLEKAYAKLHGAYDQIENGSSVLAMADLLGAVCHNIFIRSHQRAKEVLSDNTYWTTLRGYLHDGWLLAASVKTDSKTERLALDEVGIPSNALNEVTRLVEFGNHALVQMHFPRGRNDAAGGAVSWGMGSLSAALNAPEDRPDRPPGSVWLDAAWFDKLPDAAYKYMLTHCVVDPGADPADYRWVTFEVFATFFNKVYIARTEGRSRHGKYSLQREQRVGRWLGRGAGGRLHCQYFTENPCFCLRVKEKNTPVLVQLSQPDCRLQRRDGYAHAIGLYIVKSMDGGRKKRYWKKDHSLVAPKFVEYRDVATEVLCQPYTNYFLIPCTAAPGVEMPFMLTLMSQFNFAVSEVTSQREVELKIKGAWKGRTAGGRVSGQPVWRNNPQYRLTVSEPGVFGFILHQKPVRREGRGDDHLYYISLSIYKTETGGRVVEHDKEALQLDLEFQPFGSIFSECALEVGTYTVVPMTWEHGEEGDFELSVISAAPAHIAHINTLVS